MSRSGDNLCCMSAQSNVAVESSRFRVVIADDHAIVRQGLAALLKPHEEFELVGQAATGFELLRLLDTESADVAVVDVTMPGPEVTSLPSELRSRGCSTRLVALTMHCEAAVARRILKSGFSGYVHKDDAFAQLIEAIHEAIAGRRFVSDQVRRNLEDSPNFAELSNQEQQVLRCVAGGMTNKRIASELEISIKTVETYRSRLMRKFDVHSAAELIRIATRHGWI